MKSKHIPAIHGETVSIGVEKRPPRWRVKSKKIARYLLAIKPYILFKTIEILLKAQQKAEKSAYKKMLKYNLLENYLK